MADLPLVICLMGPTASGKTPLAIELVQTLPCDIISVDSAMVYRGMDIGTAKPTQEVLAHAPHQLIDIADPSERYSAGKFCVDAMNAIRASIANQRIPLLVGGTMLYFRVLQQGLATLPVADQALRDDLQARADKEGWLALHATLAEVDPVAANKINPNDAQRIQRALEVYYLTGKPISLWQTEDVAPLANYHVLNIALMPGDRKKLHAAIAARFDTMLAEGFIEEVKALYARGDLTPALPSVRSVGYREAWDFLAGNIDEKTMREKAIAATRQLAKRQITWLRTWPNVHYIDSQIMDGYSQALKLINHSHSKGK